MTAALIVAACVVLAVLCVVMAIILDNPKSRGANSSRAPREARPGEKPTSGRTSAVASRPGTVERRSLRSKCRP